MNTLAPSGTVSKSIEASSVNYFKTEIAANKFLYIKAKAPASGGLTVALQG